MMDDAAMDDAAVQVMSRLGIDITEATKSIRSIKKDFGSLNVVLRETEGIVKGVGPRIAKVFRDAAKPAQDLGKGLQGAAGLAAKAGDQAAGAAAKVGATLREIANLEAKIMSVAERAGRSGREVAGLDARLEEVRAIRDAVLATGELDDAQKEAIASAQAFIAVENANIQTLEKEAKTLQQVAQARVNLAESTDRAAEAERLATEQQMRSIAELSRSMASDLARAEKRLTSLGMGEGHPLVQSLSRMRSELIDIERHYERQGELTISQLQRAEQLIGSYDRMGEGIEEVVASLERVKKLNEESADLARHYAKDQAEYRATMPLFEEQFERFKRQQEEALLGSRELRAEQERRSREGLQAWDAELKRLSDVQGRYKTLLDIVKQLNDAEVSLRRAKVAESDPVFAELHQVRQAAQEYAKDLKHATIMTNEQVDAIERLVTRNKELSVRRSEATKAAREDADEQRRLAEEAAAYAELEREREAKKAQDLRHMEALRARAAALEKQRLDVADADFKKSLANHDAELERLKTSLQLHQQLLQARKQLSDTSLMLQSKSVGLGEGDPLVQQVAQARKEIERFAAGYNEANGYSRIQIEHIKEILNNAKNLRTLAATTANDLKAQAKVSKEAAAGKKLDADAQALVTARAKQTVYALEQAVMNTQRKLYYEGLGRNVQMSKLEALGKEVRAIRESVVASKSLTAEQVKQVGVMEQKVKLAQAEARFALEEVKFRRTAGQLLDKAATTLTSMASRRISWFLTGSVLFGAAAGIRSIVQSLGEIEFTMIEISRIMEDPTFQGDAFRNHLMELGREFGFTFATVGDIAKRWAQAGYDVTESLEATRASLLALNTAELDAEQSTQSLIGIMQQWSFDTSQLITVIDKINKVSDDYAVSSQDIVDGLLRASSAARNANYSFEQTVAVLTAMRVASGRTGKEVGNALNSIISFMQRPIFRKTLEEAGIPFFANVSEGKLRPQFEILADLAAKWEDLTDAQKASIESQAEQAGLLTEELAEMAGVQSELNELERINLAQSASGNFRRNYLLALLNNFSMVYDVILSQEQAAGYSMRENERTMESYQKKVDAMRVAWEQLLYTVSTETPFFDSLKWLVDSLKNFLSTINDMPRAQREIAYTTMKVMLLVVAVTTFDRALLRGSVAKFFSGAMFNRAAWSANTQAFTAFIARSGKAVAIIVAVAGALILLNRHAQKVNREAMRLQDTFDKMTSEMDANVRDLEGQAKVHSENALAVIKLADEYRVLGQRIRETAKESTFELQLLENEQRRISMKVSDMLGEEVAERLEHADYSVDAAASVAKAENEKSKVVREAAASAIDAYRMNLSAHLDATLQMIQAINNTADGWESYLTFMEKVRMKYTEIVGNMWKATAAALRNIHEFFQPFLDTLSDRIMNAGAKGMEIFKGAATEIAVVTSVLSVAADKLADSNKKAIERFSEWEEKAKQWQTSTVESISNAALRRATEHLNEVMQKMDEMSSLSEELRSAGGSAGEFAEEMEKAASAMRALADAIIRQVDAVSLLGREMDRELALLDARMNYFTRETSTKDELIRADEDRARAIELITQRQAEMHREATAARAAIERLQRAQASLDTSTEEGAAAYEDLSNKIEQLRDRANGLGVQWWVLQQRQDELIQTNYTLTRTFEETTKAIQDNQAILSLSQQEAALRRLANTAGLSADQISSVQSQLTQVYGQRFRRLLSNAQKELERQLEAIETATKRTIKNLEAELDQAQRMSDARIKALQDQLDAMDEEDRLRSREKAEEQHLNKMIELREKLMETEAKLNEERAKKIEETNKRIAELEEEYRKRREKEQKEFDEKMRRLQDDLTWYQFMGADKYAFEIAAIEKQMADLRSSYQEKEQEDTESHTKRIEELRQDLHDFLIKNEEDLQNRLAEIRKDMAEEEKSWAETLNEWRREDLRRQIQDQINAEQEKLKAVQERIQEQIKAEQEWADKQRDTLQKRYKEITDTINDGMLDALALLASQDARWFERGQSMINALITGIKTGNWSEVDRLLASLQSSIQDVQASVNLSILGGLAGAGGGGGGGVPSMSQADYEKELKKRLGSDQAVKDWLKERPTPMSVGGMVMSRSIIEVAEAGRPEIIMPIDRIVPIFTQAMGVALRQNAPQPMMPVIDARAIGRGIGESLAAGLNVGGENTIHLTIEIDGDVIDRRIVNVFDETRPTLRSGSVE